jgi:ferredoxin--NADP+ reductase
MPFAITSGCCTDASCVSVCPVNCIHPTPDEPEFATTDMLFVDPVACIDCGACADACPVDAVLPVDGLPGAEAVQADRNREYYATHPADHTWGEPQFPRSLPAAVEPRRIAIVGTGPSAAYAARALLQSTDADLTLIDRLPVAGGLIRSGVAPDHPQTKQIGDGFADVFRHPRVRLALNVEVGRDISADELLAYHSAALYAVGAATDRTLGVPGESLPGSHAATDLVGWYNAHPDRADLAVDLDGERAVVVGTGNVAIDVARILLSDPDDLAATDISDLALESLRNSRVREVVLLGRRGLQTAAFTPGEFLGLRSTPGIRIVVDGSDDIDAAALKSHEPGTSAALLAESDREAIDWSAPPPAGKRVVFRFNSPITALHGTDRVEAVETSVRIPAHLLIRAIGYSGRPVPGLPFDEASGTVPNEGGRVIDPASGKPVTGTYVLGWMKRGPSGGIGTNRGCAAETVSALLDDAAGGRLPRPQGSARDFDKLLRRRNPDVVDGRSASAIDRAERDAGERSGRPRVKFLRFEEMLHAGRRRPSRLLSRPSA